MRQLAALIVALLVSPTLVLAQASDYGSTKAEAERLVAEGSYARARVVYERAHDIEHPPSEDRWIAFRLADLQWRSESATDTSDTSKMEAARKQLETLAGDVEREDDRDRVWAEANESLGDYWWVRRNTRNWSQAWQYYQKALDWWAGARDVDLARTRYLAIIWRAAEPPGRPSFEQYGSYGPTLPTDALENALTVAQSEGDKARAHYLIAMTLQQSGDLSQMARIPEEYEAALKAGKTVPWYDDALYSYASFLTEGGRVIVDENGQWRREQDYPAALDLYRRLTTEFGRTETPYYDEAVAQVDRISRPQLTVIVSNAFQPGTVMQYAIEWRNTPSISLALYPTDLARDATFPDRSADVRGWIGAIPLVGKAPIATWVKETGDTGDHRPGRDVLTLEQKLEPGAYILEARSDAITSRDVILVTDAALVVETSGSKAIAFACGALDGAPISGARVAFWEQVYDSARQTTTWRRTDGTTDKEGVATADLTPGGPSGPVVAFAAAEERQTFATGFSYRASSSAQPWKIYVYTDRPAYRPGEEAQWKIVARQYADGQYTTPANRAVEFQVDDARGAKVTAGRARLNEFGSAWGSLSFSESMPLGEYHITFWDEGRRNTIGSATLLRLEEYKLPEFKVSVSLPEENGRKKAFRLGEKVDVSVDAEYYFGGAVANATTEVIVYQNYYYRSWGFDRQYAWLYADSERQYSGRGQIIKRETLQTDAEGHARISFDTPRSAQQDFEYTIEARVTDTSRREIVASDTVRVTRQRYYVYAQPDRTLVRPDDTTKIHIKTIDANEQPVAVEGTVTITRDYWTEVWIDPKGKEVRGDDLRKLKEKYPNFPPPTKANEKKWQIKSEGYEHDKISEQTYTTGADGTLDIPFNPTREGYYRFAWVSRDKNLPPIEADASVWAAKSETAELGYRSGGLEVMVDSATAEVGGKARVMIAAPPGLKAALLTVAGDEIYDYQVVRMNGTVKLLELDVTEKCAPNVYVTAVAVADGQMFMATTEIVVPPAKNFLNVEVKADKPLYKPGDEGTLTVTTRDSSGQGVPAEVGLSVADDAVYYIQGDLAGDPRKTFFGQRRQLLTNAQSTFQSKVYARLVPKIVAPPSSDQVRPIGGVVDLPINGRSTLGVTAETETRGMDAFAQRPAGAPGQELTAATVEPAVVVRSDFRATAFWQPDVITNSEGTATVQVKFPESLTSWRATARVATTGNQFGIATAAARTRSPLTVRLQAPRFFVAGDVVTISAIVNNNSDAVLTPRTVLRAQGVRVTGYLRRSSGGDVKVVGYDSDAKEFVAPAEEISPGGEQRYEWEVRVERPGDVSLQVETAGGEYGDAMVQNFVAHEHGVEKLVAGATRTRGPEALVVVNVPAARQPRSTKMSVRVSPSLAATMLDAIPYLVEYPYGCTEQTMSRFMPAAVVAKTLADQGIKLEDIEGHIFGPLDAATPPPEGSAVTPAEPATEQSLGDVEKAGLERLYELQHDDGGWGWWKDDASDHYMTAYVIWGLTLARGAGLAVKSDRLAKAADWLNDELVKEEKNLDMQAWMLHALAVYHGSQNEEAGLEELSAFDNVYTNRDQLAAYTRALLALAAHYYKLEDQTRVLADNLANGAKVERAPGVSTATGVEGAPVTEVIATAHWGEETDWWRWSDGSIEATAFTLSALVTIDPQNELIEPAMSWLVQNRSGARWTNTRDTAFAVLALNDYLKMSGELGSDLEYELVVNGQSVASKAVGRDGMIATAGFYPIDNSLIRDGVNEVRLVRKSGEGPMYLSAEVQFFSLEEPIAAAGNGLFVSRQYFKLVAQPTLLKGYYYQRVPLKDGDTLSSGDRVETVVTVETKNDYDYLLVEDLKPAGLEAVDVRSGASITARQLTAAAAAGERRGDPSEYSGKQEIVYRELRDRKVALFASKLSQGVWEVRYELRAETPGAFHVLPVVGEAMYAPDIRGNGAEGRLRVQ